MPAAPEVHPFLRIVLSVEYAGANGLPFDPAAEVELARALSVATVRPPGHTVFNRQIARLNLD